jgi:transcriptional regulator with XRE-family HTH domain
MDGGNLGERVRAVRKARDLSQEALAREAGVSLNLVNKLERGVVIDPHYSTLSGIARALGVPVQELVREPAVLLAEAPPKQAGPNALTAQLTAEIAEVQDAYQSRLRGLVVLTERWETRLRQFGDDINQETLENMAVEGSCLTEFFLEATLEEMGKIAEVVGHAWSEGLASGAAFDLAAKVSIMRPAYERWKALGDEIQRIGVKLFGEDRAQMSLENFEPGWATRTGLNEMAKRRAQKIQVA